MRPTSAIERLWVCICAITLVGTPLVITSVRGALGIPRNDDWSYLKVALDLAESGQVHLTGWVQMFFLGQAVLAQPVIAATGGSIAALQLFVAALAVASLVLAYDLLRRMLSPALAALAVLPLALGPMFGSLSLSFMTDIPALFLSLATLSLGAAALRAAGRRKSLLLLATAISGLFAFTIREYGLLAWIAVALTMLWPTTSANFRTRAFAVTALTVSLIAAAVLWLWRSALPGTLSTDIFLPTSVQGAWQSFAALCAAIITLGMLIAPAMLVIRPIALLRPWTPRRRITMAAITLGLVLVALAARSQFPIGNLVTASGNYPGTIIGTWEIPLLPSWAMTFWAVLGLGSLAVMALVLTYPAPNAALKQSESPRPLVQLRPAAEETQRLLAVYLALTWLLMTGFALLLDQLWDRYLLAIIPITAGLLLTAARNRGLVIGARWSAVPAVGLALFTLLGLAFTDRAAAIDGASWAVSKAAVSTGVMPEVIDGGFTWNGTWQSGQATWPAPHIPGQPWWRALYPDAQFCSQVQVSAREPKTESTAVLEAETLFGTHLWFAVVPNPAAADYSDTLPQC